MISSAGHKSYKKFFTIREILKLTRIHKPLPILSLIGYVFISLGGQAKHSPFENQYTNLIFWILLCIITRSLAAIINDILDVKIDINVKRTATRPLAKGSLSKRNAYIAALILATFSLLLSWQINYLAIVAGVASLLLTAIYTLSKRGIFSTIASPQLILGVVYNPSIILALCFGFGQYFLLKFSAIFLQIILFDLVYSRQDVDEDRNLQLNSLSEKLVRINKFQLSSIVICLFNLCCYFEMRGLFHEPTRKIFTILSTILFGKMIFSLVFLQQNPLYFLVLSSLSSLILGIVAIND